MWKNEKIDELEKTSDKVLAIIEEKPRSQREILRQLAFYERKIHVKVLSDHLKRLLDKRKIGYFGNKVKKLDTKILLRKYYRLKGWPEDAHKIYIFTPQSGELYKKMIKKYKRKNKNLVDEIVLLYRRIEMMAKFQEMYTPEGSKIRSDIMAIYNNREQIVRIQATPPGFKKLLDVIKMTPFMFVIAYSKEQVRKDMTIPMFNKLRELFIIMNKNGKK